MKKILSLILSFTMAMLCFNVNIPHSYADIQAMLSIADVTGEAGETVDVEIEISNNPGIIAISFDVEYDTSKLKLVKAEDEKLLGTSTSVFGKDLSANPYRLCWDDLSDSNNEQNGVLATLTFEILEDAAGEAEISLILNQGSTFNIDFEDVEFAVSGGKVNIGTESETPATDAMLSIADVSGKAGETVDVEVEISNNPGIIALSFDVEYDSSKLKLVKAEDKKILGTSTSVFGKDLSANPYRLCWDDLSEKNNEQNGVLATLTFEILDDATGAADINLILNQGSTFNIDFEDVEFAVSGGKVNIGTVTTTTTKVTATTTKPTTTTTKTTAEKPTTTTTTTITTTPPTTTVTTTTTKITTTTTVNPAVDAMLSIANVTGKAGETVDVDIEISNNPGIIAISFDVEYDSNKLKLVSATDKKLLGTSTSVFGKDLSANPYRLCWDDLSDSNNKQNGVLATLTFEILEDATGAADIDLILNQGSTFNIDFEDVDFAVAGGKVNIGTVTTTTTTTKTTTTTTTTTIKTTTTTTTITTTTPTTMVTTTTTPPTTELTYLLGDVNADGSVDSSDASRVLAEYAKIQTGGAGEFTDIQYKAADVNKDDVVDSSDASKILAYYAMISTGKEPTWD